jgi:hypothetical protein
MVFGPLQIRATQYSYAINLRCGTSESHMDTRLKQTGIKSFCASSSVERATSRVDQPTTSPTRRGRKRAAASTHAGENVEKLSNTHASVDPPQVVAKEGRAGVTSLGDDAEVVFSPKLLPSRKCKELFGKLEQEVQWEHREIRMLGRYIMQPRLVGELHRTNEMSGTGGSVFSVFVCRFPSPEPRSKSGRKCDLR